MKALFNAVSATVRHLTPIVVRELNIPLQQACVYRTAMASALLRVHGGIPVMLPQGGSAWWQLEQHNQGSVGWYCDEDGCQRMLSDALFDDMPVLHVWLYAGLSRHNGWLLDFSTYCAPLMAAEHGHSWRRPVLPYVAVSVRRGAATLPDGYNYETSAAGTEVAVKSVIDVLPQINGILGGNDWAYKLIQER